MELKEFHGRLNTDVFTNKENMCTQSEFNSRYPIGKYHVFEIASINGFINELKKAQNDILIKAIGEEKNNDNIEKAINDLKSLEKVYITDTIGQNRYVYIKKKEVSETLSKGIEESEKPEDNLEKGIVTDAFMYGSRIIFTKTGKQIKEKIGTVIISLDGKKDQIVTDLTSLSDDLINDPTEKPSPWRMDRFKNLAIPYKIFNWNQTYYYEKTDGLNSNAACVISDSGTSCSPVSNKEEADSNRKWNDLVYAYIDTLIEIEMLKLYQNNLDDKKSYELTTEQLLALQF